MITALTVLASFGAYLTGAAWTYRIGYERAYEHAMENGDRKPYRSAGHDSARLIARDALWLAPIWPIALVFLLATPVPPTLAKARADRKAEQAEKELQALERAAGIRQ